MEKDLPKTPRVLALSSPKPTASMLSHSIWGGEQLGSRGGSGPRWLVECVWVAGMLLLKYRVECPKPRSFINSLGEMEPFSLAFLL